MVSQKKDIGEKAKYIKQILPNKNTNHGGNDDQYWEIRNPSINHTGYGKYDVDIIHEPNQKYLDNKCIRIGKKIIQHVTIESKHGFLGFTSFRLKKN